MAKAKKKSGKKSGDKLPREIAGVKVPKDLRRPAAKAKAYIEAHPVISEAVAAGMLAAAAALMANKADRKTKTVLKAAASAVGGRLMAGAQESLGLKGKAKTVSRGAAKTGTAKARGGARAVPRAKVEG